MGSGRKHSFHPGVERLEERSLMASHLAASLTGGVLRIEGTNQSDQIIVREVNGQISVDRVLIRAGGRMRASVSDDSVSRIEVRGLGGNDRIDLGGTRGGQPMREATVLWGGEGNDTIIGDAGKDRILGGPGNDVVSDGAGNDFTDGGAGNDKLDGGSGSDTLLGGVGNDTLKGRSGNDQLFGGAGNDNLFGGAGNDRVDGGPGRNLLVGETGNDFLTARGALDRVDGGAGRDVARLTSASPPRGIGGQGTALVRGIEFFVSRGAGRPETPPGNPPPPGNPTPPGPFQAQVARILSLLNTYRSANGLAPLTVDARLTAAAQFQADYMARTGDYSHTDSDGRTLADRVRAAGYRFAWVGENLHLYDPAIGRTVGIDRYFPPDQIADYFFDGWQVSPEHNANLLSAHAANVGVAIAQAPSGQIYAAMVLGHL